MSFFHELDKFWIKNFEAKKMNINIVPFNWLFPLKVVGINKVDVQLFIDSLSIIMNTTNIRSQKRCFNFQSTQKGHKTIIRKTWIVSYAMVWQRRTKYSRVVIGLLAFSYKIFHRLPIVSRPYCHWQARFWLFTKKQASDNNVWCCFSPRNLIFFEEVDSLN